MQSRHPQRGEISIYSARPAPRNLTFPRRNTYIVKRSVRSIHAYSFFTVARVILKAKGVLTNTLFSFVERLFFAVTGLVLVPIAISHLGLGTYGVWGPVWSNCFLLFTRTIRVFHFLREIHRRIPYVGRPGNARFRSLHKFLHARHYRICGICRRRGNLTIYPEDLDKRWDACPLRRLFGLVFGIKQHRSDDPDILCDSSRFYAV